MKKEIVSSIFGQFLKHGNGHFSSMKHLTQLIHIPFNNQQNISVKMWLPSGTRQWKIQDNKIFGHLIHIPLEQKSNSFHVNEPLK